MLHVLYVLSNDLLFMIALSYNGVSSLSISVEGLHLACRNLTTARIFDSEHFSKVEAIFLPPLFIGALTFVAVFTVEL